MTTVDAVREVLKEWVPGDKLHAYEIHNRVIRKLRTNGVRKRPLDSTVLRRMREMNKKYGVRLVKHSESLYVKEEKLA